MKISHDIWDKSPVRFDIWRREIAKAANIVENANDLYTPKDKINWEFMSKQTDYTGYWKEHPGDPIWFLLAHHDCLGYLKPIHADQLADRLKTLLSSLPGAGECVNHKTTTKNVIKGLKAAAKEKEEVTFSSY